MADANGAQQLVVEENTQIDAAPTSNEPQEESPRERLTDLTARATALYAVKKYEEAAELYSEATEIQAELNGEMAEENADLLFYYGRCLFYVAQKTSGVLGGTAATAQLKGSDKKPSKKRKTNGSTKPEFSSAAKTADVVPADDIDPTSSKESTADKPFFHIEGDTEDWVDSDDDEAEDEEGPEDEEEEDDFNTAFEVLDMSRVLYTRTLESKSSQQDQQEATRSLKTRIADIYDLQAEIGLEGEKFTAAVADLRSCLELKEQLLPQESSLLAECHYKLSLALEAACQVQQRDADGNPVGEITIDWDLRNEAVDQQAKAIDSARLRVTKAKEDLASLSEDKSKERQKLQEEIDDVEDITQAMEQRLEELKKPPVSIKAEAEKDAAQALMGSVLGEMLAGGQGSKEDQKAKLAEVMAGANDLSGMVKRKKPKPMNGDALVEATSETESVVSGKGKRKLEQFESEPMKAKTETVKKVRIEDVID